MPYPTRFSFRDYVTLIRNQSGGQSGNMAAVAILGILKKRELPGFFAPDFSYAFSQYFYDDPGSPVFRDQLGVLKEYGGCPEVSFPTNYDRGPAPRPTKDPLKDPIKEASHFKISTFGAEEEPDISTIKKYLNEKGPVWATMIASGGISVIAIIGYDDAARQIEYQDCQGDRWGVGGIGTMPYSRLGNLSVYPNVHRIRYVENLPDRDISKRLSVRVKVTTVNRSHGFMASFGRNVLTVKLGVEGHDPLVIWDRQNSYWGIGPGLWSGQIIHNFGGIFDDSKTLFIDSPAPSYWASQWPQPPVDRHWYLEIENHSSPILSNFFPTVDATLEQFTFSQSAPLGQIPVLEAPLAIPAGQTRKVLFESLTGSNYVLSLSLVRSGIIKFASGKLRHKSGGLFLSDPGKTVVVRRVHYDAFHVPMVGEKIGACVTDSQGEFKVPVPMVGSDSYQAFCGATFSPVAGVALPSPLSSEPVLEHA